MGSQSIFIKCCATLVFFNLLSYLFGYPGIFEDLNTLLIATFMTIIIPMLIISGLDITGQIGVPIRWALGTILLISILFSITIPLPFLNSLTPLGGVTSAISSVTGQTKDFVLGIGLASNLMAIGTPDINSVSCLPYYFFLAIGIMGLISGYIAMVGGGD